MFFVEAIRNKITLNNENFYEVKWLGYPETSNTIEPYENIKDSQNLINSFENSFSALPLKRRLKKLVNNQPSFIEILDDDIEKNREMIMKEKPPMTRFQSLLKDHKEKSKEKISRDQLIMRRDDTRELNAKQFHSNFIDLEDEQHKPVIYEQYKDDMKKSAGVLGKLLNFDSKKISGFTKRDSTPKKVKNQKIFKNSLNESEDYKTDVETNNGISSNNSSNNDKPSLIKPIIPIPKITKQLKSLIDDKNMTVKMIKSSNRRVLIKKAPLILEKKKIINPIVPIQRKRIRRRKRTFRYAKSRDLNGKIIRIKELIVRDGNELQVKSCWKVKKIRGRPLDFVLSLDETLQKTPEKLARFFVGVFRKEIVKNLF